MSPAHARRSLRALCALGVACVATNGCHGGKEKRRSQVGVIEARELTVKLYSDLVHRSYFGPGCAGEGGGRGGIGHPTWKSEDDWSYTLEIEARDAAGRRVQVVRPRPLARLGFGRKPSNEPFDGIRICANAADGRIAFRALDKGERAWTPAWASATALVVGDEAVEADDCAAALAKAPSLEAWLARELDENGAAAREAFFLAVNERRALVAAIDYSLRDGSVTVDDAAIQPLLDAVTADPTLAEHVLDRLKTSPAASPTDESSAAWATRLLGAVPTGEAKRRRSPAGAGPASSRDAAQPH